MSCASYVRRHINLVPIGVMFTTRDCLKYGSRQAVDLALKNNVDRGIIVRLTSGVFMRVDGNTRMPSALEIAKLKAEAFGKELVEHGEDLAKDLAILAKGNEQPTFLVNGANSSFRYRGVVIKFRGSNNKRMHLKDAEIGKAVNALWSLGKDDLTDEKVEKVILRTCTPDVRRKLVLAKAWMPVWLARSFRTVGYPCPIAAKTQDADSSATSF